MTQTVHSTVHCSKWVVCTACVHCAHTAHAHLSAQCLCRGRVLGVRRSALWRVLGAHTPFPVATPKLCRDTRQPQTMSRHQKVCRDPEIAKLCRDTEFIGLFRNTKNYVATPTSALGKPSCRDTKAMLRHLKGPPLS